MNPDGSNFSILRKDVESDGFFCSECISKQIIIIGEPLKNTESLSVMFKVLIGQ